MKTDRRQNLRIEWTLALATLTAGAALAAPPTPRPPARPPLAPATPAAAAPATAGAAKALEAGKNLCFNGSFDVETNALAGWTYDYQWEGNSHYMANHTRVSALTSHGGRSGVLFINGTAETKVESRPIKFEPGARYRCSLLLQGNTTPHIYFAGYKWVPGVRPYEDPHVGDLRKIYKSEFRNHQVTGGPGGWKRESFEFPMPDLSELAMKHLKEVRFITVYMVVVDTGKGQAYVDDVEVVRIQ